MGDPVGNAYDLRARSSRRLALYFIFFGFHTVLFYHRLKIKSTFLKNYAGEIDDYLAATDETTGKEMKILR